MSCSPLLSLLSDLSSTSLALFSPTLVAVPKGSSPPCPHLGSHRSLSVPPGGQPSLYRLQRPAERHRVTRAAFPPLLSRVLGLVRVRPFPSPLAPLVLRLLFSRGRFSIPSRPPGSDPRLSPLVLGRLFQVPPSCVLLRLCPEYAGRHPRCHPRPVPLYSFRRDHIRQSPLPSIPASSIPSTPACLAWRPGPPQAYIYGWW